MLQPPSDMPEQAQPEVVARLHEVLGDFFADRLGVDQEWALGVLGGVSQA